MRLIVIAVALSGCTVFKDAREELKRDVTVIQLEFARLYSKKESQ